MTNRDFLLNNFDIILQKLNVIQDKINDQKEITKEDIAYSDGVGYTKLVILDYMKEKFWKEDDQYTPNV